MKLKLHMQKICAFAILALFLVSLVPFAAAAAKQTVVLGTGDAVVVEAQASSDTKSEVTATEGSEESSKETPTKLIKQINPLVRELKKDVREVRQDVKEVGKDVRKLVEMKATNLEEAHKKRFKKEAVRADIEKMHSRVGADLMRARGDYLKAHAHFADVRADFVDQRAEFNKVRLDYSRCKDSEKEECKGKRKEVKKHSKEFLAHAADMVLAELQKIKERVEASEDLSEDEIASIVADLDERIASIEQVKVKINALTEESAREEYNAVAKDIREAWKGIKGHLKKHVARVMHARLGNILHRAEKLEERFYKIRDTLAEKDVDVRALDAKLDAFSAKLDIAAEKYELAQEKFKSATTPKEVDEVAREVHKYLVDAKAALRDARALIRDTLKEIRASNKGSVEVEGVEVEGEARVMAEASAVASASATTTESLAGATDATAETSTSAETSSKAAVSAET